MIFYGLSEKILSVRWMAIGSGILPDGSAWNML